jgi:hypothetical protein
MKSESQAFSAYRRKQKTTKPYSDEFSIKAVKGKSFSTWAQMLLADDLKRIETAIYAGLSRKLPAAAIGRAVVGSMGIDGADGVTEVTKHKIGKLGIDQLAEKSR